MSFTKYHLFALASGLWLLLSILLFNVVLLLAFSWHGLFLLLAIGLWIFCLIKREQHVDDVIDSQLHYWRYGVPIVFLNLSVVVYSFAAFCFTLLVCLLSWSLIYWQKTKQLVASHSELYFPVLLLLWTIYILIYRMLQPTFVETMVSLSVVYLALIYYLYQFNQCTLAQES